MKQILLEYDRPKETFNSIMTPYKNMNAMIYCVHIYNRN